MSFNKRVKKAIGQSQETKVYVRNAFYNSTNWHALERRDLLKEIFINATNNGRVGNEIYVTHIRLAIRVANLNVATPSATRCLIMHDKDEQRLGTDYFFEKDQSTAVAGTPTNFNGSDESGTEYLGYMINRSRYVKYHEFLITCGHLPGEVVNGGIERRLDYPSTGLYHQQRFVTIPINKKITFMGINEVTEPNIKLYFFSEKLLPYVGNADFSPNIALQWWVHYKDA